MDAPAKRLDDLRARIRHLDRKYYVDAAPEVTDREYDHLLASLKELEQQHPDLVTPDSPTQRIGDEVSGDFASVTHRVPMLSIENTYSLAELKSFFDRVSKQFEDDSVEWVLELKIDGVAASIIYENGLLVRAVTRGNGLVGDDITHTIRTVPDIPLRLAGSPPPLLEVRGEAYMTNPDLAALNLRRAEQGLPAFANTRNVTAGTIRLQDPKLAAERRMRFFCHGVGFCEGLKSEDHMQFLAELQSYGLPATPHVRLFTSADEVIAQIDRIQEDLHELDFEVDGLVLKVNRFDQREKLGATSKSPRWVAAYKIEKYEEVTKLLDIRVQVGKTGTITPVAELEPVQLAGTTVSKASLHNAEEIERKDIRIGDWVVVEKAGKIIPHIVRVELHRRGPDVQTFAFPTHCPECSSQLIKDEGGVYIRCTNRTCPAQWSQKLRYFASRAAMDIDGLGEKIVDQLVEAGLVQTYADLYRLTAEQLETLESFGTRKSQKLLAGIQASTQRGLARVLAAISIRHVGKSVAILLANAYPTIEQLQTATTDDLAAIDEIGDIIAASVFDYVHSEHGQQVFQQLADVGVRLDEPEALARQIAGEANSETGTDQPWSGKSFVVTGTLSKYKRDEIEAIIARHGGRASSSVSKKTDYLIAGEKAGSKLAKAQQLGVEILSETTFDELLNTVVATEE